MTEHQDLTPAEAQEAVDEYLNGANGEPPPKKASPPPEPDLSGVGGDDGDGKKPSAVEILLEIANAQVQELFHDGADTKYSTFADVLVDGHRCTYAIESAAFSRWLRHQYHKKTQGGCRADVVKVVVDTLVAEATYNGGKREVFVRVGECPKTGYLYIDLGDKTWRAIEVRPEGWKVIKKPPVRFKRGGGTAALPTPKRGGSFDDLRPFLNQRMDDDTWLLICGWLCAALRPGHAFPPLIVNGEQASAKSTLTAMLRQLVDPNVADLRSPPREEHEMYITANSNWCLVFENVSRLLGWQSDMLCRLSTGGACTFRSLFTDMDEVIFRACRPLVLNGIEDFVVRGDLADRAVFINLPHIPKEERVEEKALWARFEKTRPHILGAILDALSTGLRELPNIKLTKLPRMTGFATWGEACSGNFTANEGAFLEAYENNRESAVMSVIEGDAVATAIRDLAHDLGEGGEFVGCAKELLERLEQVTTEKTRNTKTWPRSPRGLSDRVMRAAPALREAAIHVERLPRSGRVRPILIKGAPKGSPLTL
ncbi:MAG: hypothetical protein OEN21_17600 [Myxococcales bacterium]|nr:hypothetical protein [Myxococcales bacterium]